MADAANNETIEEGFNRIEAILKKMESGEVSLEEAFKLYNEGIGAVKNCNDQIDKIEKQIIVLSKDGIVE